jgi:threonine/homoserine/homoserine lactone efflux protein
MHEMLILLSKSIAIGIIASVPLGPVGALCIQRTLSRGLLPGFFSGMGAAVADALFACVAILGLSCITNFIDSQQDIMRTAGGGIMLFLGTRIYFSTPVARPGVERTRKGGNFSDFFSVLILMMTNPLAIFLFLAAFASLELTGPDPGTLPAVIIVTGVLAGASAYWLIFSTFIDYFSNRFRPKLLFNINKTAGIIILVLGVTAIISVLIL